jgi:hypothetical protein
MLRYFLDVNILSGISVGETSVSSTICSESYLKAPFFLNHMAHDSS